MITGKISALLTGLTIILALFFAGLGVELAFSQEGYMVTEYLHELSKKNYESGRYREAMKYLRMILLVDPEDKEAKRLMFQIERLKEAPAKPERKKVRYIERPEKDIERAQEEALRAKEKELQAKIKAEQDKLKTKQTVEQEARREAEAKIKAKEEALRAKEEELKTKEEKLKAKKMAAEMAAELEFERKQQARGHYTQGESYYRQRKYQEAITEFQKALELKPDYAKAIKYIERSNKKVQEAKLKVKQEELKAQEQELRAIKIAEEKALGEAEAKKQQQARGHYTQGESYFRQHKYQEAIAEFNKSLELKPDYTPATRYIDRSNKKIQEAKLKAEQEELQTQEQELKAIEKEIQAKLKAGEKELQIQEEKLKTKEKALQVKIKTSEEEIRTKEKKLQDKIAQEQELEAIRIAEQKTLREAEAKKEKQARQYYTQGQSYYRQHKYQEAIAEFQKVLELKPD